MKKSNLALALASIITLSACNITEQVQALFSDFSNIFIEELWKNIPEWSLWADYGKYDDI